MFITKYIRQLFYVPQKSKICSTECQKKCVLPYDISASYFKNLYIMHIIFQNNLEV